MTKRILSIATACMAGMVSCTPPRVPPPRFQPNPPYPPEQVYPYGPQDDMTVPPSDPTQPSPQPPPTATGSYPTAKRTVNPDEVVSPYEPFNIIDIAGFTSGQLARDPSNQKIFRIP